MAEKLTIVISLTDKASQALKGIKSSLGGLGSLAKSTLMGGIGLAATGAAAALGGVTAGLGLAIREAIDAEGVLAQLDSVLKSTGGAAGVTRDMATDLADSLSAVTRFSDDAVLSGENILLTFTNIGKDVFPAATETMLDMSQALGQDLQSSAIQLGKALQDPVNGVTALKRVGVNFTESQIDMIEGMVASGDAAQAQALILRELQTEFGGSAQAAGGTFAGQLDILRNSLLNVAEGLGMEILPLLSNLAKALGPIITEKVTKIADVFTEFFYILQDIQYESFNFVISEMGFVNLLESMGLTEEQAEKLNQVFVKIGRYWLDELWPAIQVVTDWLGEKLPIAMGLASEFITGSLIPAIVDVAKWTNENLVPVLKQIFTWLGENIPPVIQSLADLWRNVLGPAIVDAAKWISENLVPVLKDIWVWMKENIPPVIQGLVKLFTADIPNALSALKQKWDSDFGGIKTLFTGVFNHIKLVFQAFQQAFSGDWRGFGETVRKIVDNSWDTIKKVFVKSIENLRTLFLETDWGALGKAIIQGIASGLGKFLGLLRDAAIAVANAALEAIKGFLGISSPSQVMADQVGKQMAAGISQGFLGGLRDLTASVSVGLRPVMNSIAMPAPAYAFASTSGSRGGGTVVNNISVNPGVLLSFSDESDLEIKLKPLIQRWVRKM